MAIQFSSLGVSSDLTNRLAELNITAPTEIQQKAIPKLLSETNDFVGVAKTGTGKTLAFGVPLLQLVDTKNDSIQGVILAPTRELGQQIASNLLEFSANTDIAIATICGGTPIKPQIERLAGTTHVVVATPGRLIDLIQRNAIQLQSTKYLVLDEADEMVTGLKDGLDKIVAALPKARRTFLFSATLPGAIKQLIQNYMSKHVTQVSVDMNTVGNAKIEHKYVVVDPIEKLQVLLHFLASKDGKQGIVFCKTKAAVNKLAKKLAINKISSGAIHGSLSQGIRDRIMEQFRAGYINILVATDLAARGIDVKDVSYVINYHLPDTYEAYVHRSGRTGRAEAEGLSLTVLQQDEVVDIADFENELGIRFAAMQKPNNTSIEENNTVLWAKKIFKTKPNKDISPELKSSVKTVFHHLTKDELIEKLLANYTLTQKNKKA